MMSMKEDSNGSINSWLGFSLSPHMKMEANTASDPPPPTSASFYLSSSQLNNSTVFHALGENGDFQSPLSVMPVKSDGSLCIMEALSRSHSQEGMVQGSSPKLEDFLGGGHQMDTVFEPFRQQQQFFSGLNFNGLYQPTQEHQPQVGQMSGAEFPCLKTWVDHGQELEQQVNNTSMVEDRGAMGCGELQSLSLSMSPGSQSSCVTASRQISPTETTDCAAMGTKKRGCQKMGQKQTVHRKSIDAFGQRTSQYRGVTRHRWTGRYEAHLWDNSCKKEGQTRKGRQVYLGGYDMEEKAARAYDLAALKYWGLSTHINFPLENYHQELEEMKKMSRQEYVAHLRRKSSGFSRGASIYRGVTRHHQHGRWQARIGRVAGNKDLYLGTFSTQEEAAEAYDVAAIKFRGVNAVTNFDISRYDVEKIMASNTLSNGETARWNKAREAIAETTSKHNTAEQTSEICGQVDNSIGGVYDWKMGLQENATTESLSTKSVNYQNPYFSVALHDMISIASSHADVDESTPGAGQHFSNLVTSFSSSGEASPDRNGSSMLSAKTNSSEAKLINPSTNISSWIPTAQLRPVTLTAAHLPVFASWNGS